MKEYIVGIDFGNGETSAWYARIDGNDSNAVRLMDANAPGERKIRSVVNLTEEGQFSTTLPGAVQIGLKGKISTLTGQKREAYKAFIKDVYRRIIANNTHLVDRGNGNSKFHVCIACPTRWNDAEKQEYIEFFNEALDEFHQKILWVINESDAAYFAHRDDERTVLVIDYGSSTIDYTLIDHGRKVSADSWSNDYLGARAIERAMLESYRTSPGGDFQNKRTATEQVLRRTRNDFYDVNETLEFEFRKSKETGYTNYNPDNHRRPYDYNMEFDFYYNTGIPDFNDPVYRFRHQGFFRGENGVSEGYIGAVRADFLRLSDRIAKEAGIGKIDKVILSGGACIMGWVMDEIKDVFGSGVEVVKDDNPEYVVSRGIALYAKAQKQALKELLDAVGAVDFQEIYKQADLVAMQKVTEEFFPSVLADIVSNKDYSGNEIFLKIANFFYGLNSSNAAYVDLFRDNINIYLTTTISAHIKSAIKDVFNIEKDTSDVNIGIDVQVMDFREEFFTEGNGGKIIFDILVEATGPHIFTGFDPDKKRGVDQRKAIVEKCKKMLFALDPFGVGYDEADINDISAKVKEISLKEAERIFYEKELFRTFRQAAYK